MAPFRETGDGAFRAVPDQSDPSIWAEANAKPSANQPKIRGLCENFAPADKISLRG
jgi:hypothetical protein